ncbi:MAG: hypothetical protein ABSF45_03065 [Terriglobia bacterium]|jgi:hypothetical protein
MRVLTFSHFDQQAVPHRVQFLRTLRRASWRLAGVVAAILMLVCMAAAQQEEKPKIPGLDKIISANEHLAYTGTVKSVDAKHNILSINSVEGGDTEIFPIKHSTHVETADGFRKKLEILSPGTRVIVYYDQHADHRTVTRIELLASESKKKEPHS